ncbi:hypothetical protein GX441_08360 [bacterium]|nr:hypothetical protein [bacterium]
MKKPVIFLSVAILIAAGFVGCDRFRNDEELIKDLLISSYFSGEGSDGITDDASDNPNGAPGWSVSLYPDTVPSKWVRKLTYATRVVTVKVEGDSAWASISRSITGRIYIDTIPGNSILDTISRPIADTMYREVTLKWNAAKNRWVIENIQPAKLWTPGASHPVEIEKIEVSSSPSGETFVMDDPTKFISVDDLPWLRKDDTVTVTVTAKQLNADDTGWCYLHHGRNFNKAKAVPPNRKPFEKESTWVHKGTWKIGEDNVLAKISVRHAGIDLIYAGTLSYDPAAEYSAFAFGFPYIVYEEGETLPDDGQETNE